MTGATDDEPRAVRLKPMHAAVIGAGALGVVYGVRLALGSDTRVTFVVRPARVAERTPMRIERVDGDEARHELVAPVRAAEVPRDADVVIVAVRFEQLGDELLAALGAGSIPVVVVTPLLPEDEQRLRAALGKHLFAALPSVVAYLGPGGAFRYWLPPVATRIDAGDPTPDAIGALVSALAKSGISARIERNVYETNLATTMTFIPLMIGIGAAGSVDALLGDREVLQLALDATREGGALATRLGRPLPGSTLAMRVVGPLSLRAIASVARMQWAEAVRYLDEHFGPKLHDQNVAMTSAMVSLAREHGTPHAALARLSERLAARRS